MANKNLAISAIFIDIEDSTGIANHFKTEDYRKFLSQYHSVVKKVVTKDDTLKSITSPQHHSFFGDEFMAFLPHKLYSSRSVSKALELATKMKIAWYISDENARRLDDDKEVIEINIGVNFGIVSQMPHPFLSINPEYKKKTLEGFPITVAKRAQSVTEQARASRIILADGAYRQYVLETGRPSEFDYVGRRPMKGLAQSISCYEWLGTDFMINDLHLDDSKTGKTLLRLYEKNPLNPWYALLLAYHHFAKAEDDWYEGKFTSPSYRDAADVCLKAIHSIQWSPLRQLSSLLLTCLEVLENWDELGYRAEQIFRADPTFAQASAFHSKALLGQWLTLPRENRENKDLIKRADNEASRTISLFESSNNSGSNRNEHAESEIEEALFTAYTVRAAYNDVLKYEGDTRKALHKVIEHAKRGKIIWAATELTNLSERGAFGNLPENEWKAVLKKLPLKR